MLGFNRRSTLVRLGAIGAVTCAASLFGWPSSGTAQEPPARLGTARLTSSSVGPVPDTRFSNLDEINPVNVNGLKLAFSFRTNSRGGHAGSPQISGNTLVLLTPFPHTLYALDLDPGAARRTRWSYQPKADGTAEGLASRGAINAGPVVANGRVYLTTLDGHTTALDVETGRVLWDTTVASISSGETLTGSPAVTDGRVFVGNTGDDYGARGWIAALDADTGREIWRRYSTGTDADVGIGPDFHPRYPDGRGQNLGVRTWSPSSWQQGGGEVSGPILYDPGLNLLFHGTGHPAPWNPEQRPGDNKWTSGLFARDPDTGAARWFDAIDPHDLFALGATGSNLLVDREQNGVPRKLLIHSDGNGYLYVLDRASGEILSAEPFAPVNSTTGVDLATGAPKRDDAKATRFNVMARDVCPASTGAIGGATAYSPATRLVYLPVSRLCMDVEARNTTFIAGTPFTGANVRVKGPPEGTRGGLVAWDIDAKRPAWSIPEPFPLGGGALATAGGLVLYGTLDGRFRAVDARTGEALWEYRATSGIIGDPTAFRGPDGREYVAVLAGLGGKLGRVAKDGIDMRDATAAGGLANILRDLPKPADESGTLYVFRLP